MSTCSITATSAVAWDKYLKGVRSDRNCGIPSYFGLVDGTLIRPYEDRIPVTIHLWVCVGRQCLAVGGSERHSGSGSNARAPRMDRHRRCQAWAGMGQNGHRIDGVTFLGIERCRGSPRVVSVSPERTSGLVVLGERESSLGARRRDGEITGHSHSVRVRARPRSPPSRCARAAPGVGGRSTRGACRRPTDSLLSTMGRSPGLPRGWRTKASVLPKVCVLPGVLDGVTPVASHASRPGHVARVGMLRGHKRPDSARGHCASIARHPVRRVRRSHRLPDASRLLRAGDSGHARLAQR